MDNVNHSKPTATLNYILGVLVLRRNIFKQVTIINKKIGLRSYKWFHLVNSEKLITYHGYLDLLQSFEKEKLFSKGLAEIASKQGYLNILQYLYDLEILNNQDIATENDNDSNIIRIIEKTHKNLIIFNGKELEAACMKGHLNIVKFLIEHMPDCLQKPMILYHSVVSGNLELVKYVADLSKQTGLPYIDFAVSHGNLEVIKFLHEWGSSATQKAINVAAAKGHLDVVKWLYETRSEKFTSDAIDRAAENGHEETVHYLNTLDYSACTTDAIDLASMNGHHNVIRYLLNNRTEGCTDIAYKNAIYNNDKEMIDILFSSELTKSKFNQREFVTLAHAYGYDSLKEHIATLTQES